MTRQEFLDELAELLEMEPGSIQVSDQLEALGWSSLSALSFIALADDRLKTRIGPSQLANCQTVTDLLDLVKPHLSE